MEKEIKRYRIRPKVYLCLSPEEALKTGISTGEQIIEEILLSREFTFSAIMYAAIRNLPEDELKKIPVLERGEELFESRREVIKYIKEKGEDLFLLYVVKETKMFPKEEIKWDETENKIDDFLSQLKEFEKEKIKERS
ncbi:MAG: hypothetical protein NC816_01660 [Candidatus Omnitrophica bacterium]|nr:hypothetical protein [Candidatus Omnitrophota bacterium]MCM8809095.1 hypothetical protein [Candidatus Omnitrophota bacterium]MCM8811227.1 hypothetical protein [Candidatus Omnitrophota bacterium]MCM8832618.1 hypothetical protein [Candidatus Omnitrophota bacterium]